MGKRKRTKLITTNQNSETDPCLLRHLPSFTTHFALYENSKPRLSTDFSFASLSPSPSSHFPLLTDFLMAAILESLAVPRASLLPSSPAAGRRVELPAFRGLKIKSSFSSLKLATSLKYKSRRGGGIVCEAQETAVEVPGVTDAQWQSLVLDSETAVLVEFWAPWCGPCRMIHPIIDELAKQYSGKLKCYKVNTDESPSIATKYGIRSIPTVFIFKGGEKKDAVIGAVPKSTLTTSIEKFL